MPHSPQLLNLLELKSLSSFCERRWDLQKYKRENIFLKELEVSASVLLFINFYEYSEGAQHLEVDDIVPF